MKYELLINKNFLDIVQIIMLEIVINALKPILENEEVQEIYQLSLESDVDVTHMPKAERRNAIENLVDKYTSGKAREVELKAIMLLEDDKSMARKQNDSRHWKESS